MTEPDAPNPLPSPILRARRRMSIVWLIPIVAAIIGLWLAVKAYSEKGPTFTISFQSAEGLETGHTKIKYKDVEVGKVRTIKLGSDLSHVLVTAELTGDAEGLLSEHSRFWIVRARISPSGVSGLGTLVSGAYIGMDPGSPGKPTHEFTGLETPAMVTTHQPGAFFTLRAEKLGSLNVGSPVSFRQIQVGEIATFNLAKDGQSVSLKLFIRAPYNTLVSKDTRFWNAGGVDVSLDANGIRMSTDSLLDVFLGGIAFENPVSLSNSDPAPEDYVFALYPSHERIYEKVYQDRRYYVVDFDESVRGLTRGAPVEFRGIKVGQVEDLKLEFRTREMTGHIPVLITLEPERLSIVGSAAEPIDTVIQKLVTRGLRAQLKTGSVLTGSLFVDLDFYPKAPARTLSRYGKYPQIPAIPTTMGAMISNLTKFFDRLEKLPLEEVGKELRTSLPLLRETLERTKALVTRLDTETAPKAEAALLQAQATLAAAEKTLRSDSPTQQDLHQTLEEVSRAARALKDLADTLERHPESLVFGKEKEQ